MLPLSKSQEGEMEELNSIAENRGSQSLLAEIGSKLTLDVAPPPNHQESTTNRYFLSSGTDRSYHSTASSRNSSRSQPNQAEACSSGKQLSHRRSQYYPTSPHHAYFTSASSSSDTTPSSTEPSISNLSSTSLIWDEQEYIGQNFQLPPIHDHMKSLLSQLGSSISAMKAAYAHLQAAMTAASLRRSSAQQMSTADKSMVEELQRLSDLHLQLVILQQIQQEHYNEVEKETAGSRFRSICSNGSTAAADSNENESAKKYVRSGSLEKNALLKSYEGIIARFHDEIRRKDAVTEALKDTLAKSVLRGEKLERRIKSLEAKLVDSTANTKAQ
eukprot:c22408_g2_i1 orf=40-1029(-)